jgi:hypothetical protein
MTDTPELLLIHSILLLPLPSTMLASCSTNREGMRGWVNDCQKAGGCVLFPFEAFAKVLASMQPSDAKYRWGEECAALAFAPVVRHCYQHPPPHPHPPPPHHHHHHHHVPITITNPGAVLLLEQGHCERAMHGGVEGLLLLPPAHRGVVHHLRRKAAAR